MKNLLVAATGIGLENSLKTAENVASALHNKGATTFQFWTDRIGNFIDTHGSAILCALVVLLAGYAISKRVVRLLARWLEPKPIEPPLRLLMLRITHMLMLALALLVALQTAGVAIAPLLAGIGVAGVGLSLASQGVLSNIVGGLVIILTKPFRVGEYVEVIGVEGRVEAIELMSTTLSHGDRSRVMIPNRKLIGEVVHNYGTLRQLDLSVSVSYDTDLSAAMTVIRDVLKATPQVKKELPPLIGITGLGDSSINIAVKPWVAINDYLLAKGELYQAIIERFREKNIDMPFPQREIRLLNRTEAKA
jgi:small conductance mechanosensitive channel